MHLLFLLLGGWEEECLCPLICNKQRKLAYWVMDILGLIFHNGFGHLEDYHLGACENVIMIKNICKEEIVYDILLL